MRFVVPASFLAGILATGTTQGGNNDYLYDPNDEVLSEFKNLLSISSGNGDMGSEYRTLKRYAELVDMIMYLQSVPFFGQYWYYGCWCSPEGFAKAPGAAGHGEPKDDIDRACQSLHKCYACAVVEKSEDCNVDNINYRWRGVVAEDGTHQIECSDSTDSCQYELCMCDRQLAMSLREHENDWDLHYHAKWGGFNKDTCHTQHSYETGVEDAKFKPSAPAGSIGADVGAFAAMQNNRADGGKFEGNFRGGEGADGVSIFQRGAGLGGLGEMFGDVVEDFGDYNYDGPALEQKFMDQVNGKQCCGPAGRREPRPAHGEHKCCEPDDADDWSSSYGWFNTQFKRCDEDEGIMNASE